MARPSKRPDKPYTNQEIIDKVREHFIVEKNPKSLLNNNSNKCIYGKTGCAVGCLLTLEDAEFLDNATGCGWGNSIKTVMEENHNIYKIYFKDESLQLLRHLQDSHDYHFDFFETSLDEASEIFNSD